MKTLISTSKSQSRLLYVLRVTAALLISFVAQNSSAQTTTTLNFDNIADDVAITNQYQSQGVLVSGANAINAGLLGFSARSGTQVAYAPNGLMTFSLSIANVKKVSAYVTGPVDVGIYAYDASNNLVGEALLPANAPANTLLTVTSSGPAITRVEIHDGGASFAIDDISFTTGSSVPPVNVCRKSAEIIYNKVYALPASAYIRAKTAGADRVRLLFEAVAFEKLRASGKFTQKQLNAALLIIELDVKLSVKAANNAAIVQELKNLANLIKNNSCQ